MIERRERSEMEELIMDATFTALREHGYADLTISKIHAEFPKSKSLLYYHYDGKDEILRALLDFATDRFLADLDERTNDDPMVNLCALVDQLLPADPDDDVLAARRVIVELRAQAVVDPEFRATFSAVDDRLHDRIVAYLADGVESGQFAIRDDDRSGDETNDADAIAEELLALLNGALVESVTTDRAVVERIRAALHDRIDALAAEGSA